MSKNENYGYVITGGVSTIKNNKLIDASIATSDFRGLRINNVNFEDIKLENKEITSKKILLLI